MNVTFVTCFYTIKSKFDEKIYYQWIKNLLTNVNKFNLVVYTDEKNYESIKSLSNNNTKIKIILKSLEDFYNYKYKDKWIKNQEKNIYLNFISWELQMLWAEKINFVLETINNKYYDTDFFGWLDIGYFRCRNNDITTDKIAEWPNIEKINSLNKEKIYYGNVNNDRRFFDYLFSIINKKNIYGLPTTIIPHTHNTIAGGFFITHKKNVNWWKDTFDNKIKLYFEHDYLVKDDQIILVDCIFSNIDNFEICYENDSKYDNWFMFQRILLK
jgi:hypothetical protein